jgi:hypothetical protein
MIGYGVILPDATYFKATELLFQTQLIVSIYSLDTSKYTKFKKEGTLVMFILMHLVNLQ